MGWNLDIQDYFTVGTRKTNNVRNILNTATEGLAANPDRKFIYVEVAFFQLWWKEQNATWREQVRKLVDNGQLEFINAGYVTFWLNFHHFDHFELDLRGHIHVRGAAFSCLRLKLADIVLI